jgi:uncharacterized membrane protein (UPF0127 family)
MKIYNNGQLLAEVKTAETKFSKMKGLMFKKLEKDQGLLFSFSKDKKWEIWMPFVPENLGLIFLNSEKKVLDKMQAIPLNFRPQTWKIYKPKEECRYILEVRPEKLEMVEIGDVLRW